MKIFEYKKLASTQDEAKKRLLTELGPFAVFADQQVAGYGKQGRSWASVMGNYSASFVIPEPDDLKLGALLWWLSVMVCESLEQKISVPLSIKWPNDILLNGKKVCGILVERVENRLVIGIGINLKEAPILTHASYEITSIFEEMNILVSAKELFIAHCARFKNVSSEMLDLVQLYESYCSRLWLLHQSIRIKTGLETVEGIFCGVSPEGALSLVVDGLPQIFFSAEIEREKTDEVSK